MEKQFDPSAVGSDIARSRTQYGARVFSRLVVSALGLNRAGFLSTEIVQAIQPVVRIPTRHGLLLCRGGHGRLVWQARNFHTEEPETVTWLDSLQPNDVLWDVGANVGLYAIYAAKFRSCTVIALEPESQNYALLVENIALNGVGERCFPACVAVANRVSLGRLQVRYLTKGGAYNLFEAQPREHGDPRELPPSIRAVADDKRTVEQWIFGVSLDALLKQAVPPPTHLKIDVDGLEPDIIDGASQLLSSPTLRSIVIELNKKSPLDLRIPDILAGYGFRLLSERSNWLSRRDRTRESDIPTTNMIFSRT